MSNKTRQSADERLKILSSVAGRNVIQALAAEMLEIERRLRRVEEENSRLRRMMKPNGEAK